MMQHQTIKELILSFNDKELPESERQLISDHLRECAECAGTFKRWELIKGALSNANVPDASENFIYQTMERITALEKPLQEVRQWAAPRWLLPLAGYGFAIALMFVAIEIRQPSLINAESVLLSDIPESQQWTLSGEPTDVTSLLREGS